MRPPRLPADTRGDLVRAAVIGALAGFLSGLFGVGGGILIVPGLVLIAHMDQRLAHGTSLAAIVPIAAAGVIGYLIDDKVDGAAALCITLGAMLGALAGTKALQVLPARTLRLAFALILLLTAARLFLHEGDPAGRGALDPAMVVGFFALGLASGALSGLLGVGGGIIMVPVMVLGFGIPSVVAKGTSLLVIIPTSLVGTWRNLRNGNARIDLALAVGVAGTLTAFAGARVSIVMSDVLSAVLFGLLLVFSAARLLLTDRRERRGSREAGG
ncbi:MAG: anion permease [Acidimicrobiia bacterium]|nr:MAG: anion permease [Acidimicrobiia bacterium]